MGKLSKNVIIYFIGNIINRFMGVLVTLFATHILTNKEDLGYFNYVSSSSNLILTIFCLQIWMAIIRFIFDYKSIKNKLKIITNGYFIGFLSFTIYLILLIIYCIIKSYAIWLFLELFFLGFSYVFNQMVQFSCRGLAKNKLYVLSGVVSSIFYLVSSVIMMVVFKMTSSALILSTAISYISQGIFIEFFLNSFKKTKLKYLDFKIIKKMLKFSIPTTINSVAYIFNQSAYIWLLNFFYDKSAIGAFTPAFRMTSLIGLFVMSFNFAFQEYSFYVNKSKFKYKIYNKNFNYFFRFISSGTIILLPATCIFFSFMIGSTYKDAKILIPILYLGSILESLQIFLGSIMQAEKKVIPMFFSQIFGSFITIIVMFISTKYIGLQSAGLSMAVCFLTITILRLIFLKYKIKLKFKAGFLLHFIPIYLLTTIVYLKYNAIINGLYLILTFFYFVICNKNLFLKLIINYSKKNKSNNNNKIKSL